MSQYRDGQPQYSGRSPSPAFYAVQGRYDAYDDQDEELNYPVDNIGYSYDPRDSVCPKQECQSTTSKYRWCTTEHATDSQPIKMGHAGSYEFSRHYESSDTVLSLSKSLRERYNVRRPTIA